MLVQCKVVLQQARAEEVRRFEFQDKDLSQLKRVISQLFPALSEAQFAVFWEDDDDDFVSISSNEELQIAIKNSSELLRLYVKTEDKCRSKCSSEPRFKTPTHRQSRGLRGGLLMLMKHWNQIKRKQMTSCDKTSDSRPRCEGCSSRCSDREQPHSELYPSPPCPSPPCPNPDSGEARVH